MLNFMWISLSATKRGKNLKNFPKTYYYFYYLQTLFLLVHFYVVLTPQLQLT